MFRATNSPILRSPFLTVYITFGTVHRHCCRPAPWLRWNWSIPRFGRQTRPSSGALFQLYIQLLVQCTDTAAFRCLGYDGTDQFHVSVDKLAHPQDHFFNCIFSFWYSALTLMPTGAVVDVELISSMFRATNSPILRSTFLTVYTAFGTMHRHCCRPVPRLRWNSSVPSQPWHRSATLLVHCTKSSSWSDLLPETCRVDFKRLINEKDVASCWLLTSLYWWCMVTQT